MRNTKPLIVTLLAVAIVFTGMYALTQGRGDHQSEINQGGNNRREQLAAREPADIHELRDVIEKTIIAVDDNHWDEATHSVHQIRQRWVSYKPGMRAGAGVRMWPTTDVNRFESALGEAEGAVSRQQDDRAMEALRLLDQLAESNDHTREGAPINEQIGRE